MNNVQLDMVLGYLNEGTEIDTVDFLWESLNEEINNFEYIKLNEADEESPAKKGLLSKIKEILAKIAGFIKKVVGKIVSFITGLFKKNKVAEKAVVEKAKSVDAPKKINEAIEKEENKPKVEIVKKRQIKLAKELTGKEEFNVSKLSNSEFLVPEWTFSWHFNLDNLEKLTSSLKYYFNSENYTIGSVEHDGEKERNDALKYRYANVEDSEVEASKWNHNFKFKKMDASEFVNPSKIIEQYKEINTHLENLNKAAKRYEKISKDIEIIAKTANEDKFEDEEHIREIRKTIKYVQNEVSVCSKGINEIMKDLNLASNVTTQNYNTLLSCLKA